MNKSELIAAVAEKAGMTKVDSAKAVNAFVEAISGELKKGEKVQLIGFGTFSVNERPARTCRNPRTGKNVKVAAKKVAKFKAGKGLI